MDDPHALTHLATILAAAFIGGAVFRKLKQPVLVGYIIVGLILSPSVLGVVQSREEVSLLAELGILLLLFIVGMEIDLKSFRAVSKISLITCGAQILIGLVAMVYVGLLFGWPMNRSILLGFAVALSSTAVALKILEDMGLRTSKIGQTSVGVLVAQDLAFILAAIGLGAGTIQSDGYKYVMAIISLSLLATPLWLFLVERRELLQSLNIVGAVRKKRQKKRDQILGMEDE